MTIELGEDDRVVFHGTNRRFDTFDSGLSGRGGDSNSRLGTHFADSPVDAMIYAEASCLKFGGDPVVVVAALPAANPCLEMGYYEFFGYDETGKSVVDGKWFENFADHLRAMGHDVVDYEDGEQTIFVGLRPEQIRILAYLDFEEAEILSGLINALPDPEDDHERLRLLREIIIDRAPSF